MNRGYGSHAVAGGQSHVRTVAGTVGEFSGNGPAAGRVSSTPMKSLSYLGSDHTGFGWEMKVRLEIVILLPRRRHRFFLASHVPERPESGGRGRCSTACGGFFHSEQQKTCRFDRSCISWSVVYLIASKNIEVYPIFFFDWDFSTIHILHFTFVIPLFD